VTILRSLFHLITPSNRRPIKRPVFRGRVFFEVLESIETPNLLFNPLAPSLNPVRLSALGNTGSVGNSLPSAARVETVHAASSSALFLTGSDGGAGTPPPQGTNSTSAVGIGFGHSGTAAGWFEVFADEPFAAGRAGGSGGILGDGTGLATGASGGAVAPGTGNGIALGVAGDSSTGAGGIAAPSAGGGSGGQGSHGQPATGARTATSGALATGASSVTPPMATPVPTAHSGGTTGPAIKLAPPGPPPPSGGNSTVGSLVPTLYQSTAANPSSELVQAATDSQAQNPMTNGFSASGVRYVDGTIQLSYAQLTSAGFGNAWGQTLDWTNGTGYANTNIVGKGWVISQMPLLQQQSGGNTIAIILSGTDTVFFDLVGSTWTPRYFMQDVFTHDTTNHLYDLTDDTGKVLKFKDFSSGVPTAEQGTFYSLTDQFGDTTSVTAYTSSNQIQEVQSSSTVGSTTITESYLYTYLTSGTNSGLMSNVTLRRKVNSGSWTTVRQVAYTYYDGVTNASLGNAGDLELAVIEDGSGNALDTYYYRYYVSGDSNGYLHGLKYAFGPQAYERLAAAFSTPLSTTNTQAAPYADLYLQFNSQAQVSQAVVAGAGSSLASSNVGLGTYTFSYTTSSNSAGVNSWAVKTVETLPDSNTNTVYTNKYGEVMLRVYHDQSSGNNWEWFWEYDSAGRVILAAMPSAVTGYNDSYADLLHYASGSYQYLSNSTGLIDLTVYYSSTTATSTTAGGVLGDIDETEVEQGQTGTAIVLEQIQYLNYSATVNSITVTVNPVATDEVYRNTNTTGGETTSYSYTWFSSSTVIQSETVTEPTVTSGENGPGAADTEVTFFNSLSRPIWHKDGDGYLSYIAYDQATSAVVKTIADVNTADSGDFSNLPSGWSTPSGGGLELITQMTVDSLGRTTELTDPNGNITYTVYIDTNHQKNIYPGWNSSTHLPTGPTQVLRSDLGGSYTETLTMSATPHLTSSVPDGTESISSIQTLSRTYVNIAGQAVRKDDYFSLSGVTYSTSNYIGTQNTNYYTTLDDYDNRGRLTRTDTPTGTINRTVYDGLSRLVSVWVGTDDTPGSGSWSPTNNTSPANMVETKSYQYDSNGVGDSDMTQETDYPGGSAANRVENLYYDWRDRLVATKQGVQTTEDSTTYRPIMYYTFDNLNEVTETQRFDGDGVTITSTSGVPNAPSSSLLRAETVTSFDEQQRLYQTVVYDVNQSTGSVSSTGLTTNDYYNHRGQLIEESEPGGVVMKYQYDGAGRRIEAYTTDGAGGTSWSAASSVSSDDVLEQTDTTYDTDGNVILAADRQRDHNDTTTGALGNVTTSPEARIYYAANYYDAANRLIDSVNVGDDGGSTYTRPSSVPSDSATVLVTSDSYNAAGWVQDVTDPRGIDNRTIYDNLGRVTQTVQDYTNGTITATTNKTTNYTYDGDNHVLTLQAMETGGNSETTQWNYGVTTSGGSEINSNDMLVSVEYPDPSTGSASTSYEEKYTVDALDENLTYTDRAGNVHTYSYDVLGRLTSDAVTTLATGFDNSVLRIQTAYNALSDPYTVTEYNAASGGSIVDQVEDVYNGLNQLTQEYQSHSGAVNTSSTPSVQYTYTELASGNNSRLTTVTYPDNYAVTYNYGSGLDSSISRLTSLSDSTGTLESYLYLGLATVVQRTRSQINEEMTYISQTSSTGDGGDQYTGLDRFGRVVEVNWYNTSSSSSTDDFQYGYDQDNNVLWKNNTIDSVFSELYHASGAGNGYDNLNQLSAFARGTLSASGGSGTPLDTVSSPSETESWSYDALGNFASVTLNGTPTSRTNNQQNETTALGSASLAFDTNGNTTTDDQGHTLVYDAWNRLVTVKNGGTTIAAYAYDAVGRRVQQTESSTATDIYFDNQWRDVEEQVSSVVQTRYVWSPINQDAMVLRDDQPSGGSLTRRIWVQQDANWDVTSIVSSSGSVVERYVYDPYGAVTYLTATWGSASTSAYGWQYLFQSGRLDGASALFVFERRDYTATLGRWVEVDPLRYQAADNDLYRSEDNEPASNLDPSGTQIIPGRSDPKEVWKHFHPGEPYPGPSPSPTPPALPPMPVRPSPPRDPGPQLYPVTPGGPGSWEFQQQLDKDNWLKWYDANFWQIWLGAPGQGGYGTVTDPTGQPLPTGIGWPPIRPPGSVLLPGPPVLSPPRGGR
jgi:RHS repeat-associated protein